MHAPLVLMFTDERGMEDLQVVLSLKVGGTGRGIDTVQVRFAKAPSNTREGLEDGGQV